MEKTKQPLSTFRLVAGIITIVLSVLVTFQSCAAGLSNALEENGESGGSAGVLLAVCFLVAGIVGIVTRKSTGAGGAFTSAGFYIVGGLIGLICAGSYADLVIWGVISVAFGVTGGAFGVADKDHGPTLLLLQKYISCPFRTGIRFFQTKLLPNTCVVQSSIRIFSAI